MNQVNDNPNEASSASQCRMIAGWLNHGQPITSLQALRLFGCMRLASRIHDLRSAGMDIVMERVKTPSGKTVASYRINNKSNINQIKINQL